MRFFAVFLLFALILAVTARNVPKLTPEQAAEFNAQQIQNGKRSLQDAVHEWLNPDKVPSSVIRLPANSGSPTLRFITSLSLASLLDSLLSFSLSYSPHSLLSLFPRDSLLLSPLSSYSPDSQSSPFFRHTISLLLTNDPRSNVTLQAPSTTGSIKETQTPKNSKNETSTSPPDQVPLASSAIGKPPRKRNSDLSRRINKGERDEAADLKVGIHKSGIEM